MSRTASTPARAARIALIPSPAETAAGALTEFLASDPGLVWLGAFGTDQASLRALGELRPSVVVADLRVDASLDVGRVFRDLFAASATTQIVAICAVGDEARAGEALAAGAAACLSRHSDPLAVLRAINEAMRGRMHLSPTGQRAMRGILDPRAVKPK